MVLNGVAGEALGWARKTCLSSKNERCWRRTKNGWLADIGGDLEDAVKNVGLIVVKKEAPLRG